eukprot:TRINITY_DN58724_c0_g1_i1.p1 TRINITY_DN58724_c0_g1~~TRINITY_DN58724_c0_g1_i1.p1  ORF type:complete len:405 (-),score=107.70 TRINITY_DN58724_c0_g1_i1:40-1254(-)
MAYPSHAAWAVPVGFTWQLLAVWLAASGVAGLTGSEDLASGRIDARDDRGVRSLVRREGKESPDAGASSPGLAQGAAADDAAQTSDLIRNLEVLREAYLDQTKRALMGMLTHGADNRTFHDDNIEERNYCNTRFFSPGEAPIPQGEHLDMCIVKWDGWERLTQVQRLYERVHAHDVPGDVVECGLWRGGISIFARALVKAYGEEGKRKVWGFDSFEGVPQTDRLKDHTVRSIRNSSHVEQRDADFVQFMDVDQWGNHSVQEYSIGDDGRTSYEKVALLTVHEGAVRDNFERYGLMDESVHLVKGYFNDTLPKASDLTEIALLRMDGDLYWSTWDILENLYPKVVTGGWVIADDWALPQSQAAIEDYQKKYNLTFDIQNARFDGRQLTPEAQAKGMQPFGYWRKE